jgi:hypothetical protein
MTNAKRFPALLLTFGACLGLSACATRQVQCQFPAPPPTLLERQPVDNLDRLRTFYQTLQPSQPSEPTETPRN